MRGKQRVNHVNYFKHSQTEANHLGSTMIHDLRSLTRALALWLTTTAAAYGAALLALPATRPLHSPTTGSDLAELLTGACAAVLLALAAWFWLTTTVITLAVLAGRAHHRIAGCPDFVRRGILLVCGVALTGSLAVPAHARDSDPPAPGATISGPSSLSGLPLPDRLAGAVQRTPHSPMVPQPAHSPSAPQATATHDHRSSHPGAPEEADGPARHTVVPGDTLWDIAAAALPAGASQAHIADYWQQIYQANRAAIGADPDLIQPGTQLLLPNL